MLKSYDGDNISYDGIGNPTSYRDGKTFSWAGRQLLTHSQSGETTTYSYDSFGLRTLKSKGATTTTYIRDGSILVSQTTGSSTLVFIYDGNGEIIGFKKGRNTYYYLKNLLGDVLQIIDSSGNVIVEYEYDDWGYVTSVSGSLASTIGAENPFRYRGYYYDSESGLYYLNSRYYDPETGRFINADAYVSTGQGLSGNNMFAYCGNNPVNYIDESGLLFFAALGAAIGGATSFIDALRSGQTIAEAKESAQAGIVSGFVSGLGVDIGLISIALGHPTFGVCIAGSFGAAGNVIGTRMTYGSNVDLYDYIASAFVGGVYNMISLGTGPEIVKGPLKEMVGNLLRGVVTDLVENTYVGTLIAFGTAFLTKALTDDFERTKDLIDRIQSGEIG